MTNFLKGLPVVLLSLWLSTSAVANPPELRRITDVQSMILRTDGNYDVTCKNGPDEIVTPEQIALDRVCNGNSPQPTPTIEALFARPQGDFFVLCKTQVWQVATAEMIKDGRVCAAAVTPGPCGHVPMRWSRRLRQPVCR